LKKLQKTILEILKSEPYRTFKVKEISRRAGIPQHEYQSLRDTVRTLAKEGKIVKLKKNLYGYPAKVAEITGQLLVNSQGYGFVSQEEGEDIFISQKNMGVALHKDTVRVRLLASTRGKSPEGIITEVLSRSRKQLVGTFTRGKHYNFVIPDDLKINQDIIIASGREQGAQDGDKVVVTIDSWEHRKLSPAGEIVQILGDPATPGVDITSLVHHFELPVTFPLAVNRETENLPSAIPADEYQKRLDLRNIPIFTIDPDEAKDFDDAISLENINGIYRLGVHIADVSYYIPENSVTEQEAAERGTSVYLVDRVIPMLPEKVSNVLCSLVEGRDRLCYSVLMDLDEYANVTGYEIRETIIKSVKRFTYREAQDILDGKLSNPLQPLLSEMLAIAKKLVLKRQKRGGVDFDSLEVGVTLDDQGHPVDIVRKEHGESNRMIEEFMLLANETVARHVGVVLQENQPQKLPFVYRIHEKPDEKKIREFLALTRAFGFSISMPKRVTPGFFQKMAKQFEGHQSAVILEDILIRTMMKARYSTDNIGHFGLAYTYYTHFTSPIRRYPDLMVHRLLKKYARLATPVINKKELQNKCNISTEREIRAQEAERACLKLKKAEYMEARLGQEFTGIISRVVSFGFFVEIPELLIDGLVHVTTLDEYFILDEKNYTFIGKYTGKKYKLGDTVKIRVSHVDRNERIIDFILAT